MTNENEASWRARQREGGVATPPLALAVTMFPTPAASWYEGRGTVTPETWEKRQQARTDAGKARFADPLHVQVAQQMARHITLDEADEQVRIAEGSLNPAWVEWLMGFPANWTDIGTPSP